MSFKHGRKVFRNIIKNFNIQSELNYQLYKSVYGVSKKPSIWPTKYYEKRIGPKPSICSYCGFKAINSKQIELHHIDQTNIGIKNKICGTWKKKLPGNQKYKNPNLIFSKNCNETYRLQKVYYLKWHLESQNQYKCCECNIYLWNSKILSLELHHKDGNQSNSLLNNLELLCPNCHRAK